MSYKLVHTEMSSKDLHSTADFIKALHTSGRITTEQRRLLTHAIMAGDSHGNLWTIGTQTGKWYKQSGDKWIEGQPPEKLLLVVPEKDFKEAEIQLDDFKFELEMKALHAKRCSKCGSAFTAGALFCTKCGAVISTAQSKKPLPSQSVIKCLGCGQAVEDNQNFCSKCGRKLTG